MGFFDRDVHGGLDRMFDFNHDGVLDSREQMAELMYWDDVVNENENDDEDVDPEDFVDSIDFEIMDDDEKREYLEENGLDPEDYDIELDDSDDYDSFDWE